MPKCVGVDLRGPQMAWRRPIKLLLSRGVQQRFGEGSSYRDVYLESKRKSLAVVSLFAIVSGEGGLVLAREDDEGCSGTSVSVGMRCRRCVSRSG